MTSYKSMDHKKEPILLALFILSVIISILTIVANFIPSLTHVTNEQNDSVSLFLQQIYANN